GPRAGSIAGRSRPGSTSRSTSRSRPAACSTEPRPREPIRIPDSGPSSSPSFVAAGSRVAGVMPHGRTIARQQYPDEPVPKRQSRLQSDKFAWVANKLRRIGDPEGSGSVARPVERPLHRPSPPPVPGIHSRVGPGYELPVELPVLPDLLPRGPYPHAHPAQIARAERGRLA